MSFETRAQLTAQRLINSRGKTIVCTSGGAGVYDPDTGAMTVTASAARTVKAIVGTGNGVDLVNGTLIRQDEKSFMISALGMTVNANDTVTLDGMTYLVTGSDCLYAGELPVTINFTAKKA